MATVKRSAATMMVAALGVIVGSATALFAASRPAEFSSSITLLLSPRVETTAISVFGSSDYIATRARSYATLAELDSFTEAVKAQTGLAVEDVVAQYQAETAILQLTATTYDTDAAEDAVTAAADLLVERSGELESPDVLTAPPAPVLLQVASPAEESEQTSTPPVLLGLLSGAFAAAVGVGAVLTTNRARRSDTATTRSQVVA